jgi:beta-mannosidase
MPVIRPEPDAWTVACTACAHPGAPAGIVGRSFPAVVPGCVHLDLERAGVLPPVDVGDGEERQEWVGHADWTWTGRIDVPAEALAAGAVELCLDSVDTVAEVALNGVPVGSCASQFVPWRFGVRGAVRAGPNEITVRVRAPVPYVRSEESRLGPRPVNGDWTPYSFVRKSACNFGWDWGPRVPTSGIPGDVRIECWDIARIAAVRPLVDACDAERARVMVHVDVACVPDSPGGGLFVRCELRRPPRASDEERAPARGRDRGARTMSVTVPVGADGRAAAAIEVERPERWWPRGFGAQPLHSVRVELVDAQGRPIPGAGPREVRRIGLRTGALDTSPDDHGSRFSFLVNGVRIPVTGANWIPASPFPVAGRDDAAVERLLELAVAANLNMLRVWGGGIHEPDAFYDRCDELGILVWQDFMFACATYPEDAPMPELVEREARAQVSRCCAHPSIVLWCGGNEDVLAWQSWGFRERLAPGQSWGRRYWLEVLPAACAELDPSRPYWPESPWSGALEVHANDPDRGDRHTWDLKLAAQRSMVPRFTSEYGHQSPPTLASLREALGEDALVIGSPALARRQRAWGGDEVQYAPFLSANFPPPDGFAAWLWQAHLLQARAMRTMIAWTRANPHRSGGSLFWQLNDVWTGHSWSVVDARMRPKPAWHAVRQAARPRLVTIEPVGPAGQGVPGGDGAAGSLRVVLVNDSPSAWNAPVEVRRVDVHGRVLASAVRKVRVPPRGVDASIDPAELVGVPADPAREGWSAEVPSAEDHLEGVPDGGHVRNRAWWWFAAEAAQSRTVPDFAVRVERRHGAWWADLSARSLVREAWVEPDGDWVECTPNLLTLMPGERASVMLRMRAETSSPPAVRVHCF